MPDFNCPVSSALQELDHDLASGKLVIPGTRQKVEHIVSLLEDIAKGEGGNDHISTIMALSRTLMDQGPCAACTETGRKILETVENNFERFQSHVDTRICPSGECALLTPSPCQTACPAGIDVPAYVTLIGQGQYDKAIEVIRKDNPFPWVCGLVCTHPCESKCVRGRIDTPVSIKFLKAFAAEQALSQGRYTNPEPLPPNGKKVCVVGAGPAGMTAAYYLALKGYAIRVIEQLPTAGGMLNVGIPRYRLPMEVIDREVDFIRSLGVEFQFNTKFGWQVHMDQLKNEGFESFLITIGAHKCSAMSIPGENDFSEVYTAVSFLREVSLGERKKPGDKVLVVGGGNVAIDSARTCLRLGSKEVILAYRRTRAEMPADEEEIKQAEEEGVKMNFLTIPTKIDGKEHTMTRMHFVEAELVECKGSSRKTPVPIFGSDFTVDIDAVIVAIGQRTDHLILKDLPEMDWSHWGTINANEATMETSMKGVFAAGDNSLGPSTVIQAIAGGKKAANAIDRYLKGIPQPETVPVPVRRKRTAFIPMDADTKMSLKKPDMPMLSDTRRLVTFQQVELGYTEVQEKKEAWRCLRCDVCRRCGDCVVVCRDKMGIDALKLGYFDIDYPVETDFRQIADKCIACGACAEVCRNNAMQITDIGDERILSLCGTILNRQKLEFCEHCNSVLGPSKYLDYIDRRMKLNIGQTIHRSLCNNCSRKRIHDLQNKPMLSLF